MIIKKQQDHHLKKSPFCGDILEILTNREHPGIDVAIVMNIKPTTGHYHLGFEEIYFVLDGSLTLAVYEPTSDSVSEITLGSNELVVFSPGIHHRIIAAAEKNRLCVISLPGFDPMDETISDRV